MEIPPSCYSKDRWLRTEKRRASVGLVHLDDQPWERPPSHASQTRCVSPYSLVQSIVWTSPVKDPHMEQA